MKVTFSKKIEKLMNLLDSDTISNPDGGRFYRGFLKLQTLFIDTIVKMYGKDVDIGFINRILVKKYWPFIKDSKYRSLPLLFMIIDTFITSNLGSIYIERLPSTEPIKSILVVYYRSLIIDPKDLIENIDQNVQTVLEFHHQLVVDGIPNRDLIRITAEYFIKHSPLDINRIWRFVSHVNSPKKNGVMFLTLIQSSFYFI
ncbi:hypothetical protein RF11_14869 [Thelohanellus kitauei]|uniref:Uncharacterized protein n=1 Tax=Thelohanellus kitauei TaxID=669202 RepID=A0A0C2N9H4_THEKT|nr:hypothetical protein RF11_14869 [Thelohanellus kitauei]